MPKFDCGRIVKWGRTVEFNLIPPSMVTIDTIGPPIWRSNRCKCSYQPYWKIRPPFWRLNDVNWHHLTSCMEVEWIQVELRIFLCTSNSIRPRSNLAKTVRIKKNQPAPKWRLNPKKRIFFINNFYSQIWPPFDT